MDNEVKNAMEIVDKFNKENRYRDNGKLNNAIDLLLETSRKYIEITKETTTVPKNYIIKKIDNLALCYKSFIRKRSRRKRFRNMCF